MGKQVIPSQTDPLFTANMPENAVKTYFENLRLTSIWGHVPNISIKFSLTSDSEKIVQYIDYRRVLEAAHIKQY